MLLADGKVLIAASYDGPPASWSSAEVHDPRTGTFTALEARDHHYFDTPATLLANGKVLFAGGNK